ncbi:MAG TPA: hypothetical protein VL947_01595 [Cytophagales bacterium]|nr:hypothetical protein [Cytophagales bacterium]
MAHDYTYVDAHSYTGEAYRMMVFQEDLPSYVLAKRKSTSSNTEMHYLKGKPWEGTQSQRYRLSQGRMLHVVEYYTQGVLLYADLQLNTAGIAYHYRMEFTQRGYRIYPHTHTQEVGYIEATFIDTCQGELCLMCGEEVLYQYSFKRAELLAPRLTMGELLYYRKRGGLTCIQKSHIFIDEELLYDCDEMLLNIYYAIGMAPSLLVQNAVDTDYRMLFSMDEPLSLFCTLHIGTLDQPKDGFYIEMESKNAYSYLLYKEGEIVHRDSNLSIRALEAAVQLNMKNGD